MAKSALGGSSNLAAHEKAARRVKRLRFGLWGQTALLALLLLGSAPAVLARVYFEATERIADFDARDEQIRDRVNADTDALLRTGLGFAGAPASAVPMVANTYAGFVLLSLLGWAWLGLGRARTQQAIRDQEAEYALLALRAGARPPRLIGCFLRSFKLDQIFGEREMTLSEEAKQGRKRRSALDAFLDQNGLERRLSAAFAHSPKAPIVCSLGRRQTASGFGRIETADSDWQAVVSTLVNEADFFVLIFGSSAGTGWEFDELSKHGLIDRTLFIIPSSAMLKSQSALDAYELERGCTQLFSALSEIGYTPPAYQEGSAFYFKDRQAISIYTNNAIRARAMASFIASLPPRRPALH